MSRRSRGRRALLLGLGALALGAVPAPGPAQWLAPQSDRDLRLSWEVQRIGPSRVLVLGDVRNLSETPAVRVVVLAEGLDGNGRVASRARAYVPGEVPPRGSAPFEIRLTPSGVERQYRVRIDSFEFVAPAASRPESP